MKLKLFIPVSIIIILSSSSAWSQWQKQAISGVEINALASSGSTIFAGTDVTIYSSSNNGNTWTADTTGLGGDHGSAIAINGSTVLTGGYHVTPHTNSCFISSNLGFQWLPVNNGLNDDTDYIQSVAIAGNALYVGTIGSGVFVSTDNGMNWVSSNTGLTMDSVRAFAMLDTNSSNPTIFAGTNDDNRGTGGVFVSTNTGSTWTRMTNGLAPTNIHAIVIAHGNTGSPTLFVGTINSGVYYSTNRASNWNSCNNGLPQNAAIIAMGTYGTNSATPYIFGAGDGVYISSNQGNTWTSISEGLPNDYVLSLTVSDSYLFIGTEDSGLWRRPLSDFGIDAVAPNASTQNSLSNYPNPFSKSTTISFSTPENGTANVSIVNLLGSEVSNLYSGTLGEGNHSFTWNASDLPAGMYECIVQINGHVEQLPIELTY